MTNRDLVLSSITLNKLGVEIGGPSYDTGVILYQNAQSIDNIIFSKNTIYIR